MAVDALVAPSYPRRLILNLPLHRLEVVELLAWNMVELAPFILPCYCCRRVWYVHFVVAGFVIALRGNVDKLEDEWSSSYDARSAGEEVSANDVLEDGRFAGGLRSYYDLFIISMECDASWFVPGRTI